MDSRLPSPIIDRLGNISSQISNMLATWIFQIGNDGLNQSLKWN